MRHSVRHKPIEYMLDSESDSGRRGNLTGDGLASLESSGITFLMVDVDPCLFPPALVRRHNLPQLAAARPQLATARHSSPLPTF